MNYCLPDSDATHQYFESQEDSVGLINAGGYYLAVYESANVIYGSVLVAVVISISYLWFMHKCADTLSYVTIATVGVSLFVIGYVFYDKSSQLEVMEPGSSTADHYLWGGIGMWVLGAVYSLVICCNWTELKQAVAVINVAADFVYDTKRIVLIPIAYFVLWCFVMVIWFFGFIGVASISDSEITVESVIMQTKEVNRSEETNYMLFGMVFGMFWLTAFIMAANEFALIAGTVTWYFSPKIDTGDGIPGEADVTTGLWWTYRYQCGTLAFGSFILAVIWTIRAIFEYVGNKIQQANPGNPVVATVVKGIRCCLACFDRLIRFLNRNAYIYSCITSEGFCPSALEAFLLLLKNWAKAGIVETIKNAFIFLSLSFVSVATTVIGYFLLVYTLEVPVDKLGPCALMFVIGYLVANTFISPFDVGANTIL